MTGLLELQREFQRFIDQRHAGMERHVKASADLAARTRLEVYADAYRLRLVEALGRDYPGLRRLLDAARFEQLLRDYVQANDSKHFNIRWYGANLADFLAASPEPDATLLAELARFEWAMGISFDAPDDPALGEANIVELRPEWWPGMVLVPQRALQRLDLLWNAPALRRAADRDEELPSPECADTPVPWLLWRRDLTVHYRRLDVAEAWALDAVRDGRAFAALCEGLDAGFDMPNAAASAAGLLKRWVNDQLISAVQHAGNQGGSAAP